ncbi:MAG: peptide ABC transporter substrate-binding protein [Anaerolineae bacterium]
MAHKLNPFILTLLLVSTLFLASCGATPAAEAPQEETPVAEATADGGADGTGSQVSAAGADKTLRVNLSNGFPDIVDPQKSSFTVEVAHLALMYEGLTTFTPENEIVAGAAETWDVNEDATEWTFTLREGLKYSDGSLLNARRFEYAILRNMNPETAGEYGYITDEVAGAEAWRYGETEEAVAAGEKLARESVKAYRMDGTACDSYDDPEGRVLKVKLARSAPYYASIMGMWTTFPVKQEILEANGEDWWLTPANHVGNGPYRLVEMESQVRSRFEPNPNYHGAQGKVAIEFSYVTDTAVAFQAYQNDEFDVVSVAAEDLETIKADEVLAKEYLEYPGACTFAFFYHLSKEPFNDPKVRQAFSMALDREAFASDVMRGLALPSLTWIPDALPGHKEGETRWGYDPEGARRALAESSYGSAENLPKIVDTFPDTARMRLRHEWLVAQWKEVLGVDVELNPVEPTTYSALTKDIETAPQLFLLAWCADYPDAQTWMSGYWKTGGQASLMVGYSNPEVDEVLTEADTTLDEAKRLEMYGQAQDMIIDECPAAFMYHTLQSYLVKPWVEGIDTCSLDLTWPGSYAPTSLDIDESVTD